MKKRDLLDLRAVMLLLLAALLSIGRHPVVEAQPATAMPGGALLPDGVPPFEDHVITPGVGAMLRTVPVDFDQDGDSDAVSLDQTTDNVRWFENGSSTTQLFTLVGADVGESAGDQFGARLAAVGDLNNDGYEDWAVASTKYFNNTGRVYIYYGSPVPDMTPDVILTGSFEGAGFGHGVRRIGDVSGDGIDDLFVSQFTHAACLWGQGHVYFGGSPFDAAADLVFNADKAEEVGFALDGGSACSPGDINGDEYNDLLIGAPNNDDAGFDEGKVYIYYGGPSMDNMADDWFYRANNAGDVFGQAIFCGCDLNDDGARDVAVESYDARHGSVHLYYGGGLWDETRDLLLDETGGVWESFFGYPNWAFGHADVNGDGADDLIIGMAGNPLKNMRHAAFVYYGGAGPDNVADVAWDSTEDYGCFGNAIAGIPDINTDGYDEVAVGDACHTDGGTVSIFLGSATPSLTPAQVLAGEAANDGFGTVASGDFDGDGIAELLVGARNNDSAGEDAGKVYMYDTAAVPLTIQRIEITQAIQDEENSIPLVAHKRTAVRVYARATGDQPVPNVTGELQMLRDGSPVKVVAPKPATFEARATSTEYTTDEIEKGQDALNFYIKPDDLPAGTYTFSVTVGVSGAAENWVSADITRPVTDTHAVRILYCNVEQESVYPQREELQGYYDDFFLRVYPVPVVSGAYRYDTSISLDCDVSNEHCRSWLDLILRFQLWLHNLLSEPDARFIVGYVPQLTLGDPGDHIADSPAVVVEHNPYSAGMALAHEIGHYPTVTDTVRPLWFGLGDEYSGGKFNCAMNPPAPDVTSTNEPASCPGSDQEGDDHGTYIYPEQNKGAFDVYDPDEPARWATIHYSFMGDRNTDWSWVTENVYRRLIGALTVDSGAAAAQPQALDPSQYIMLSGVISQNDTIDLLPFYAYTDTQAPQAPPSGDYSAEVQDSGGTPLATQSFDVSFTLLGDDVAEMDAAPFLFAMPYPEGASQVVLKHGAATLATIGASANPPTVTISSPAGGEVWSGEQNVEWAAGDPDSDPLTYTLLYSADGENWLAIATNISDTTYALDTTTLAGGSGCYVEVWATDGLNTAKARSNAFSVGSKAPHATITSPQSGTELAPGDPLSLNGVGYDLEDGQLSGAALAWSCEKTGALGTGSPLFVGALPVGTHAITLTVTDSDLMTGTAAITLTVLNERPANGAVSPAGGTGLTGINTTFTALHSDPNGWQDLKRCYFHIGDSPSTVGNVTLMYNNWKNKLWLRSDDGNTWTGGFAPGSANVLENSQAIVRCEQTTVEGSGDTLSVTWAIEFKPGFEGAKKLGTKCYDMQKARAKGEWKGTWTIE